MKIAVVGGTGTLGVPLVAELLSAGNEVLALSRKAGSALPDGAAHRPVDLSSGDELDAALAGVEAVVDASNSSPRNAGPVLVEGNERLLAAEASAGVRHHVGVSIVGCDRVPMPYYEVKVEQERAIAAGEVPWTLLRATQFHTLIAWAFGQAGRFGFVPTGKARLQPIAPAVVAGRLAELAQGDPAGRVADVAGPEVLTLTELASAWRAAGHRGLPLRIPSLGKIGRPIGDGALCDPGAATAGPSFAEWLADG